MRVVPKALVLGLLAACAFASACASGFERHGDDDDDQPGTADAPIFNSGDGGGGADARLVDAPGQIVDAPMQVDAPTTGGVECPLTQEYDDRAFLEILINPNPTFCTSGADCSSSQCCYDALICVAYP
jgi:hypothetical protein